MNKKAFQMLNAPWLNGALQRFEGRLVRGQTPQALLIYGPAGTGRRHLGLTVAARLLGSDWRPSLDTPAEQLGGVPHPDYWGIAPEEDSRAIKIEQIRDLNQSLNLTSHRSGWKVALISPAEVMTHNAANTLLKTLEEPPEATTLVLVAEALTRLPPTIVSRCERLRVSPPARSVALEWLNHWHSDRAACERALAFASGSPLMARSLLGDAQGEGGGKVLAELADEVQRLIDRSVPPTTLAKTWARRDAGICLRWLYLQTAKLLHSQVAAGGDRFSGLAHLKIPGVPLNMPACCAYLDQVMEAQRFKDRSLNMEAMFADLLMWWYGAAGATRY
jgi:DNA polymerase-3 subunit delta'